MKRIRKVADEVQVLVIGMDQGIPVKQKVGRQRMAAIEREIYAAVHEAGANPIVAIIPNVLGISFDNTLRSVILGDATAVVVEEEDMPLLLRRSNHDVVGMVTRRYGRPAVRGVVDFAVLRWARGPFGPDLRVGRFFSDDTAFYNLLVNWYDKWATRGGYGSDIDIGQVLLLEAGMKIADGETANRIEELDFCGLAAWEIADSVVLEVEGEGCVAKQTLVEFDEDGVIEVGPPDEE